MYLKSKDIIFLYTHAHHFSEKLKIKIKSFKYKNKYTAVVPIGGDGDVAPPFSVKS